MSWHYLQEPGEASLAHELAAILRKQDMQTMTKSEALSAFSAQHETRCDVYCLPSAVVAAIGQHKWITLDLLNEMETEGLITMRQEEVPCAPMGPRTPPIRHVMLTVAPWVDPEKERLRIKA